MGIELSSITVGDSLSRAVNVPGYPASDGWTLHYRLISTVSGTPVQLDSTADGDDHVITALAATTALWVSGNYSWSAWVTNAALKSITILTGSVRLLPNPRVATAPLDLRTDAEIALEAAEDALAAWDGKIQSYTIGGRSVTFASEQKVKDTIAYWKAKVQRERRAARMAAGLPDPRKHLVRLGNV